MKPGPITFEDKADFFDSSEDSEYQIATIYQNDETLTGSMIKSPSNIFQGIYSDSNSIEDEQGRRPESGSSVALIKNKQIIWIKNYDEIDSMKIADNGISVVSHYPFRDYSKNTKIPGEDLGGTVDILDNQGEVLFSEVFTSNISAIDISYNGKYVLVPTLYPDNSISCYETSQKKQIWKYPNHVRRVILDTKLINNVIHVYCGRSDSEKELAYKLDINGKLEGVESKRQESISEIKKKTKVDEKIGDLLPLVNADNTHSVVQVFHEIAPLLYKTKTMHSEVLDKILPVMDPTNEEIFHEGWKVVRKVISRKPEVFSELTVAGIDEPMVILADSIDAIAEIGSKNPELVRNCVSALEEVSKKTDGHYSIKKAIQALERIRQAQG